MSDDAITPDGRAALALVPHVRQVMDTVRPMLPEGTDFGVFVLVPGSAESRVIAITTDRERVGFAVAQWFVNINQQERP